MSVQRSRPIDALQRIMTSFKHFEKKLDKLQDDVNLHGQTLSDLRAMVTNLSGGNIISADGKSDDNRRPLKKTTAIQYEDKPHFEEPIKTKRKNAVQPLPTKLKAKSFQSQKGSKMSPLTSPFHVHVNNIETNPKVMKHAQRHRKAEAPRKATTIRAHKVLEKKRSKLTK